MAPPKLVVLSVSDLTKAAGGDPWQLQDQLLAGKPSRISVMADAFLASGSQAAAADSAFGQAGQNFQNAYASGAQPNVIDDSTIVTDAKTVLRASPTALRTIGTDLEQIAAALTDAQHKAHPAIDALNRSLTELESEYLKFPQFGRADGQAMLRQELQSINKAAVAAVAATYRQIKGIVTGYENLLDARMKDLGTTGYLPPVQLDDADPNTDPKTVFGWWNKLTPTEQQAIRAAHPEIGNLNGIPVVVRSQANEQVMKADIDRIEQKATNGVSVDTIEKDPTKYGLTADDITRYRKALLARHSLEIAASPDSAYPGPGRYPTGPYPTFLYAYQPLALGNKGSFAVSIGNPDTTPNTAVVVPGLVTNAADRDATAGWFVGQAQNLYVESNRANPDQQTAVIAWMGYDSTNSIGSVATADPSAIRAGGIQLAQDVNGLAATHQGPSQHMTAVGYSGGAAVVSDAAAASHMHADDVVLLGPATTDEAHRATDFQLNTNGHVYVGEASNDLLARGTHTYLSTLGDNPDPTAPGYHATRIKAETPPSYSWPVITYSIPAHLHYFTPGSESLYATADITSGNNRLAADHMLASPDKVVAGPGRAGFEGLLKTVREGETTDSVKDDHYH